MKPEKDVVIPELKRNKKFIFPEYKDVEKVKGIFKNIEYAGTGISFPFRGNWKGPIKQYTFFDGLEYEIPRELADHLNNRCAYKTLKWISSDGTEIVNAKPLTSVSMPGFKQEVDKKKHRFMFQITG
jgi:hypothetical protein